MTYTLFTILKVLAGLGIVGACLTLSLYNYAHVQDRERKGPYS